MSLFIATGANIGNPTKQLELAKYQLQKHFTLIDESRIYQSKAVDYLNQPDFFNQVLEFDTPSSLTPVETMSLILSIETSMGRERIVEKGPRLIDIDILFWGTQKISTPTLECPHPRLFQRSFVVLPLSELRGFSELKKHFHFTFHFDNSAEPIS